MFGLFGLFGLYINTSTSTSSSERERERERVSLFGCDTSLARELAKSPMGILLVRSLGR